MSLKNIGAVVVGCLIRAVGVEEHLISAIVSVMLWVPVTVAGSHVPTANWPITIEVNKAISTNKMSDGLNGTFGVTAAR